MSHVPKRAGDALGSWIGILSLQTTAATLAGILPLSVVPTSGQIGNEQQRFCAVINVSANTCKINVSPAVQPYLALFQAPNAAGHLDLGDGTGLWGASPLQVTDENYFMTRVDHDQRKTPALRQIPLFLAKPWGRFLLGHRGLTAPAAGTMVK